MSYAWGALAAAAYVAFALLGRWSEHLGTFILLYAAAWVAAWGGSRSRLGMLPIVVGAIVFRTLLVPLEPTLSDDVYRYVWEGRIQAAGFNPYVHAPAAPELAHLRDALWSHINNPEATAIYPPLAQLVFRLLASLGDVTLFKAAFCVVDLGMILLLGLELRRRGMQPGRLALYAWNPLAVVEIAGSGHLEPLAILPLLVAILAAHRSGALAWGALGASFVVKYAALLVFPFVARIARPRPTSILVGLVLLAAVTLPYADAGVRLFDSLLLYTDKWRYNDLLFALFHTAVGSLWWAKAVAGAVLLALIAVLLRRPEPLERKSLAVLCALLFVSPTIHPWYLLWAVALLPLVPWMPLLAWSGSVALAYLYLYPAWGLEPFDKPSWIPRLLQMLPVVLLLIRSRRRATRPAQAEWTARRHGSGAGTA